MKTPVLLALLSGALLLAGCESPGAKVPVNTTKYDVENRATFVLFDSGAERSVTVSGIQEGRTPEGRLQVAANVRNRENRRIEVQINCEFKDAQGFALDSTPFEPLILAEHEQKTVRFTAMNNQPSRYTIRVRQAR